MKKKKLFLDIILSLIFVSLMDLFITGVQIHELLGLFVFALFVLHKAFNWAWIKSITKNLFAEKTNIKTKIQYFIDWILLMFTAFIIFSGILISQFTFPWIATKSISFWSAWHHFAAYAGLILISVHIGLNWSMVMGGFRKLFKLKAFNRSRTIFMRLISVILVFLGMRSLLVPEINQNFTQPFKNDNNSNTTVNSKGEIRPLLLQALQGETVQAADAPTLEEYLNNLNCSGCGRHCPLTALQCGRGIPYQQAATDEYNSLYGDTQNSSNSNSNSNSNENSANSSDNQETAQPKETTKPTQEPLCTSSPTDALENSNDQNLPLKEESSSESKGLNVIFLMSMVISGTHYTLSLSKNVAKAMKNNNKNM